MDTYLSLQVAYFKKLQTQALLTSMSNAKVTGRVESETTMVCAISKAMAFALTMAYAK